MFCSNVACKYVVVMIEEVVTNCYNGSMVPTAAYVVIVRMLD
jgi:hypothetical protein